MKHHRRPRHRHFHSSLPLLRSTALLLVVTTILCVTTTTTTFPAVASATTTTVAPPEPCRHPDNVNRDFCDPSLPTADRARDLVSRLTRDEKILQLIDNAAAIDRLSIPPYHWWTESLHGVWARCTLDGRCPTSYPMPIGIAATFNLPLVKTMASQISTEARRLFMENDSQRKSNPRWRFVGLDFWAPNINIFRDPRWGRGMETPGEDPYLSGQYAINYVKGMQEGEDPRYYKTISTLKHYTAYSVENWEGHSRHSFNAQVTDQDLVQTYLPAFEAGIRLGRAGSVMCSYNAVNGEPSCASSFLLQDILRDQWGFDGYVVGDCGAVKDVYKPHAFRPTPAEAVRVTLQAGTDLDCGTFYKDHLHDALDRGLVDEKKDLDTAMIRLVSAQIKLGMYDPFDQQPYMQYPPDIVGHPDHISTALQVARESIVLLKNENGFLPLDATSIHTVAALGPHFNSTGGLCGNYRGDIGHIVTPMEGLKKRFTMGDIRGVQGCTFETNSTSGFEAAIQAAESADVAILFLGINTSIENEGHDRTEIGLPGVQEQFMEAIAKVQKHTVLVLVNGGSVDVSAAKENPNVVAILEAFYPGMQGGQAIADVLFGVYNPSGRLPYTIHKKDLIDQISMTDMSMTNYPGRTYRYFRGEAVYPFGYGLSYTTFECKTTEVMMEDRSSTTTMTTAPRQEYRVLVTNTGTVAGDISILAFLSFQDDNNNSTEDDFSCPLSQLFGIEKIHLLQPGETKEVFFTASLAALKCYRNSDKSLGIPTGRYAVQIGDHDHPREFVYSGPTSTTSSSGSVSAGQVSTIPF